MESSFIDNEFYYEPLVIFQGKIKYIETYTNTFRNLIC